LFFEKGIFMRGRPEKFTKGQGREIGRLGRKYGGLRAHAILNADIRSLESKLRNLQLFPSGTEVSLPTVYKYADRAGCEFKRGRRIAKKLAA
jgi:hypothetical protein